MNVIHAAISRRKLTLIPEVEIGIETNLEHENEFDVTVTNGSQKFTSFQLELLAPGLDPQTDNEWYSVEPEICAKKPPGAQTQFHVVVKKPPIPAYGTTLDLTLRVFSVECEKLFTSQPLSLVIEKPRRSLRIYLPAKHLKGFPGDTIEIPVVVYNLDSKSTHVVLSLSKLHPQWMVSSTGVGLPTEQALAIAPGDSQKISFSCRLPQDFTVPSQCYPFGVEARASTSLYSPREEGSVTILPQGRVNFTCEPVSQSIPSPFSRQKPPLRPRLAFGKRWGMATYALQFENGSNQPQQVAIAMPGDGVVGGDTPGETLHKRQVSTQWTTAQGEGGNWSAPSGKPASVLVTPRDLEFFPPSPLMLRPGDTQTASLRVQKRRPWLGGTRRFGFQVSPTLTPAEQTDAPSTIQLTPESQTLELCVLPIIAPAVQIGGTLLSLLLLSLLWVLRPVGHESTVNFVRFSGDGTTVLSGSSDQTVRRWFVNRAIWQPDRLLQGQWNALRLNAPDNIGEQIGKAVKVFRHGRKNNLVAVGLEDGTIQLWDTALTTPQKTLYQGTDRVFDLIFTRDSRLLFSGHGSGMVRLWSIAPSPPTHPRLTRQISTSIGEIFPATSTTPQQVYFPFAIAALALHEPDAAPPVLVIAGQFNRLVLWDWHANTLFNVIDEQRPPSPHQAAPVVGKEQSITSLATANHLLVTADNQGYITIWDMANRQCRTQGKAVGECRLPLLDQWRDGHGKKPVRSVAMTQDGRYLASVGDDGRVVLWTLEAGQRKNTHHNNGGQLLAEYPMPLNSVDMTERDNTLLITSDANDNRVMLYHIEK